MLLCIPSKNSSFPPSEFRESTTAGSAKFDPQPSVIVFLMIPHHKTIFAEVKELSTVFQLKLIVQGFLKRPPDEQKLYKGGQLLDDRKTL
ncbi:hypothetical protein STEG23_020286, partial [Scotinomys teguina]